MTARRSNGEPTVRVLPDPDAVAVAAADRIADLLRDTVAARGRADWATTGGSTPVGIYRRLASPDIRDSIPWSGVHLWWSDDRYVPRDHPLSNVLPADQVLLAASVRAGLDTLEDDPLDALRPTLPGAPIPVANVHAIPMTQALGGGLGPAWAAADYEAELRASGIATRDGWPVFDLMLLGVGPDGHIMSVFPGSETFAATEWAVPVPAPTHVEPHISRVSLNPAVLDVAGDVVVVVHGGAKSEVVATLFGSDRDPGRWPAQLVRRPGVLWLLDEAAAAGLPEGIRSSPVR